MAWGRRCPVREFDQRLMRRAIDAMRKGTPSYNWSDFADAIVNERRDREAHLNKPDEEIDRSLFPGLRELQENGVVVHPLRLGPEKVAAMREHLEKQAVFGGHGGAGFYGIDRHQRPLADVRRQEKMGEYTVDQLLRTPHLVDFLNHPAIIDFLQLALGCVPTLYSIRAWWSFASETPTGLNQQYFHRDDDDWRFIALFLYLTDVDDTAGPHQLIAGTHTLPGMRAMIERVTQGGGEEAMDAAASFSNFFGHEFSEKCERLFKDSIQNIEGPAGSMFMANTLALHRGLAPSKSPRLIVWARYGLGPNTNSVDRQRGPISRAEVTADLPDTNRNRYVNRLLFESDPDRAPITESARPEKSPAEAGGRTDASPKGFLRAAMDLVRRGS